MTAPPKVPLRLRIERSLKRTGFLVSRTLVRRLRFERVRPAGELLGELRFRLGFFPRRRMVRELAAILGLSNREAHRVMRNAYRINDAALLEMLKMLDRREDPASLLPRIRVDGIATLRKALEARRGAILLSGHMGNGALLLMRLVSEGIPVSVVYREARMMDRGLFERGVAFYGIEGILATEGIRSYAKMVSALRRNRVIYIMADQGTKKPADGMLFRFLGKDMTMPAGPAQLARQSKAPVLPVAIVAADPVWHFEILPPVEFAAGSSLESDVETLLRVSERYILRHPQLWSWHHRRWRKHRLAAR